MDNSRTEEEDINKFLYGDEAADDMNKRNEEANQAVGEDNIIVEDGQGKGKEVFLPDLEEYEDEFEIVLDGDSKLRGLTNISLSNSQPQSSIPTPTASTLTTSQLMLGPLSTLNGQSIFDLDLDVEEGPLSEKPWRKPGADITDYFNFGFNEVTWRMYCLRQRGLREEYGNAKNNNIPPILMNNPLILHGLYPKGAPPNQNYPQQPQQNYPPQQHQNYNQQQNYQNQQYYQQQQPSHHQTLQQSSHHHQHQAGSHYHRSSRSSRSRSIERTNPEPYNNARYDYSRPGRPSSRHQSSSSGNSKRDYR